MCRRHLPICPPSPVCCLHLPVYGQQLPIFALSHRVVSIHLAKCCLCSALRLTAASLWLPSILQEVPDGEQVTVCCWGSCVTSS
jgi:hypothetical protein